MTIYILSVSLLAVLICTLSLCFRRRVSSRIIYALWLALALRICTPWFIAVELPLPETESRAVDITDEYTEASAKWNFRKVTDAVSICLFIWFNASGFYFKRKLRDERSEFCEYKGETVYLSRMISSPCVSGLVPDIYITHRAAESPQLKMILHHEYTHTRHFDNLWTFARTVILCFFWWNPIIWLAVLLSKQDCELACDETVVSGLSKEDRLCYGRMIVESASGKKKYPLGFGSGHLKERLRMMGKKGGRFTAALVCIICIIGTALSYTVPVAESEAVYGSVSELYAEENVITVMEDHGYLSEGYMLYSITVADGDGIIEAMISIPSEYDGASLPVKLSYSSQLTQKRCMGTGENDTVRIIYSSNEGDTASHRVSLIQLIMKCRFVDKNRIITY